MFLKISIKIEFLDKNHNFAAVCRLKTRVRGGGTARNGERNIPRLRMKSELCSNCSTFEKENLGKTLKKRTKKFAFWTGCFWVPWSFSLTSNRRWAKLFMVMLNLALFVPFLISGTIQILFFDVIVQTQFFHDFTSQIFSLIACLKFLQESQDLRLNST